MKRIPRIASSILRVLGLEEKDMQIYTTLLHLGTASLRQIAEEAQVPRATAYDGLKRLLSCKLVSYVDAKTHRYFMAEDPSRLQALATKQEMMIQEAREELTEVIPDLQKILLWSRRRPIVKYYEGDEGVKEILEDVLEETAKTAKKMYRIYSSSTLRDLVAAAWPGFLKTRIKKGIHVRAISIGSGGRTAGLDERRWLSHDEGSATYIFIYAEKTAYISCDDHGRLFGVMIEDEGIAQTQTRIFDALWPHVERE